MKQEIKFTNSNGERVEFFNGRPFILKSIDGLSKIDTTDSTTRSTRQHGETFQDSIAEKRQIVIGFYVVSDTADEYMMNRAKMIRVFNPVLGEGILNYKYAGIEYEIKCKPENTPIMPLTARRNRTEGEVVLIAYEPWLFDSDQTIEEITVWIGGFTFPLSLPFSLKEKGDPQINIYIEGHVETPVEIIFHGPADEPTITNQTTGEFIKINRILTSDETLYINTAFGHKTVEVEVSGIRQNAFDYINLESTFFNLQPGDNLIDYTAGGEVTPDSVEIRYKNRYLGV